MRQLIGVATIVALTVAPVMFLAGMKVENWRLSAEFHEQRAEDAEAAKTQLTKALEGQRQARAEAASLRTELTQRVESINAEWETKLAELEGDRAAVAAGTRVVYVKAECTSGGSVRAPATSGGIAVGTARLAAAAGSDYVDFRRRYTEQLSRLEKCQAYARSVMQQKAR